MRSYRRTEANCSWMSRLSSAKTSGVITEGRYSFLIYSRFKSSNVAPRQGVASKVAIYAIRRSVNIRSSASLAMSRLGPIRTNTLPRYRTGGSSEGETSATSKSPSGNSTRSTDITGNGRMLPSERMPEIFFSRASSTFSPDNRPSS